jgi:hypothetical protein
LTKATAEAKKQSSVFGAGLFAGVRAYLEAKPDKRATERDKDAMRLSEVGK